MPVRVPACAELALCNEFLGTRKPVISAGLEGSRPGGSLNFTTVFRYPLTDDRRNLGKLTDHRATPGPALTGGDSHIMLS